MNYCRTAGGEPLYFVFPTQHKFCGHVTELGYLSVSAFGVLTPTFLSSLDLMVSRVLAFTVSLRRLLYNLIDLTFMGNFIFILNFLLLNLTPLVPSTIPSDTVLSLLSAWCSDSLNVNRQNQTEPLS